MAYSIRPAALDELPAIIPLYTQARQFMRKTGNLNQWIGGYPSEEILRGDIAKNRLYLCLNNEQILSQN